MKQMIKQMFMNIKYEHTVVKYIIIQYIYKKK